MSVIYLDKLTAKQQSMAADMPSLTNVTCGSCVDVKSIRGSYRPKFMLACVIFTASGGNTLASLFNKANAIADGGKQHRTTLMVQSGLCGHFHHLE